MSDLTRPGQASFIAEAQRLLNAIKAAPDDDARADAEHDLAHLLRMQIAGRFEEYRSSRTPGADQ